MIFLSLCLFYCHMVTYCWFSNKALMLLGTVNLKQLTLNIHTHLIKYFYNQDDNSILIQILTKVICSGYWLNFLQSSA